MTDQRVDGVVALFATPPIAGAVGDDGVARHRVWLPCHFDVPACLGERSRGSEPLVRFQYRATEATGTCSFFEGHLEPPNKALALTVGMYSHTSDLDGLVVAGIEVVESDDIAVREPTMNSPP